MRVVIILVVAVGCANDVRVRYPALPEQPTGTLVLLLSQPAHDVAVAINGTLVAHDEHTSRIEVTNTPVGTTEIVIAANGIEKAMSVWVSSERPTTIPLGVPDPTPGLIKTVLGTLITITAYALLN
ncbi:MAG: hypothetical protein AB7P03_22050 [Kofleriaceae bacterium]